MLRSPFLATYPGSVSAGDFSSDQKRVFSDSTDVVLKRLKHATKKLEMPVLLTVGEDIGLNDIVLSHALTLVGRFSGRKFNSTMVKS